MEDAKPLSKPDLAYRADVIGSMLRPPYLLQAREAFAAGRMTSTEFKRLEDHAVDECITIQERAGVDVVTDGEMRRSVFASQLAQACEGFAAIPNNQVDWFTLDGRVETSPVTVGLVSKLKRKRHLSSEEFVYLRAKTASPTKMTIPSPTMYAYYWAPGVSDAAYSSPEAYMADVTDILNDEVAELARLGAEYVQIDAPEFGMLIDDHQRAWFAQKGFDPERMLHDGIEMINAIIDGHPGITFGLHICRGNDAGCYMARGGYARIAEQVFPRTRAQRLLLEYDDERSGDFAPLQSVPEDKVVVLGLITTKTAREETAEELRARIHEASVYIPLERLALSPQCGFASVAKGNAISFEIQEKKLRQVAEVARQVWEE
jgi:5-methyltetrahydropteroyltriglutamate--homocysteine methyltransferase